MKRFNLRFLNSLIWRQNRHHKHGVIVHTLKVVYYLLKFKQFKMLAAGLLHDIGKPFVAFQDESDLKKDSISYSFVNHEEASYQIIKNWKFISDYTKDIVRYHYIIRDMNLSLKKDKIERYRRLKRIWDCIPNDIRNDLVEFLKCDDLGKK